MSGATDVMGVGLIAIALVAALAVAADLASAEIDFDVRCPELDRNTDECRYITGQMVAQGYQLITLGLVPLGAIGGAAVLYGGRKEP